MTDERMRRIEEMAPEEERFIKLSNGAAVLRLRRAFEQSLEFARLRSDIGAQLEVAEEIVEVIGEAIFDVTQKIRELENSEYAQEPHGEVALSMLRLSQDAMQDTQAGIRTILHNIESNGAYINQMHANEIAGIAVDFYITLQHSRSLINEFSNADNDSDVIASN